MIEKGSVEENSKAMKILKPLLDEVSIFYK